MDKVKTKIIGTDYFKFFRVFIPLSVIFMTAGAAMGELAVPVHSVEAFIFIVAYGGVCLLIMGIYWLAVAAWLYKKGGRGSDAWTSVAGTWTLRQCLCCSPVFYRKGLYTPEVPSMRRMAACKALVLRPMRSRDKPELSGMRRSVRAGG